MRESEFRYCRNPCGSDFQEINVKIKKSIMKNHSPLKSQKVTKGRKLWLKGTGSNITTLPLIISGNSTVVMQRNLNKNAFERYDFKDKYMYFRRYVLGT